MNIIIGTAILFGATALFVVPLQSYLVSRKLQEPAYAHLRGGQLTQEQEGALQRLGVKCYILADVLVLGIMGFIGGLLGYWFIGISLKAQGWPGMIAFIGASFLALGLR